MMTTTINSLDSLDSPHKIKRDFKGRCILCVAKKGTGGGTMIT